MNTDNLHIGTCTWKYDSWQGLIYRTQKPLNYLRESGRHCNTVGVDRWFRSLFAGDEQVLPEGWVVEEYAESVPEDIIFGIKVPNGLTLTRHYQTRARDPLDPNLHFPSVDPMQEFLERLGPVSKNIGPLMFQFEYLNTQKMPGGAQQSIDQLSQFAKRRPGSQNYFEKSRNPTCWNDKLFEFLEDQEPCRMQIAWA